MTGDSMGQIVQRGYRVTASPLDSHDDKQRTVPASRGPHTREQRTEDESYW